MKPSLLAAMLLVAALSVAGCATTPPPEKVVEVQVKVKEPCISKAPKKPAYRTGKGVYPGDKAAAVALAGDFEAAEQYGAAWEAAAAGCIKPQ